MAPEEKDKIDERLKDSPLASLKPPLKKIPPYKGSPLSQTSIKYLRRNLSRLVQWSLATDLTTIERVCDVLESEIQTLRAVGPSCLEDMEENP